MNEVSPIGFVVTHGGFGLRQLFNGSYHEGHWLLHHGFWFWVFVPEAECSGRLVQHSWWLAFEVSQRLSNYVFWLVFIYLLFEVPSSMSLIRTTVNLVLTFTFELTLSFEREAHMKKLSGLWSAHLALPAGWEHRFKGLWFHDNFP